MIDRQMMNGGPKAVKIEIASGSSRGVRDDGMLIVVEAVCS
jgi:hypothetical protein